MDELLDAIGKPLFQELEEGGITRTKLVEKLKEELDATECKIFNHNGNLISGPPQPAWEIRQRARIDACKLLALYPPDEYKLLGDVSLAPKRSPEELEFLHDMARKVAQEIRGKATKKIELKEGV